MRILWEQALIRRGENIEDFNINIESDNLATIKNFTEANLGVTVMSYSSCMKEEASGRLAVVPIDNVEIPRNINIIYRTNFTYPHIFTELKNLYTSIKNSMIKGGVK